MVQPFKFIQFRQLMLLSAISSNRNSKLHPIFNAVQKIILRKITPLQKIIFLFNLLLFSLLQGQGQEVFVNDSLAILPKGSYELSNVKSINPRTVKFEKIPGRRINIGFTGNEFYFILLKLSAPQTLLQQYLIIDNTSLDSILIYSISSGHTPIKLYEGGRFIPYDTKRNFVWHTTPVDISKDASYYLIAVKAAQKNINLQFELSNYNHLQKKYEEFNRLVFFYVGIAFMISAIILLAFVLFKKPVFVVYAGYVFCITYWILDHYGIAYPNLYPHTPLINQLSKPLSSLGAAFLLLTTQKLIFFNNLEAYPVLLRLVNHLRNFLLALMVCTFLFIIPELNKMMESFIIVLWHFGLILSLILISFLPLYFIRTSVIAKIFSLAMVVICLTTLYQLLANVAILNSNFLNEHAMSLGSALENSIMAFGLLFGLVIERRDQNMQVVALQQEQKEMLEKLIYAQANERKRIAADLHDNIGPLLAALKINFRRIINMNGKETRVELIEKTESIIDDSIMEIRNLAHNLVPKNLENNGLINSLEDYFRNVQQLYGKQLFFTHEVYALFKPEIQANIYFIISELVLNAAKHSNAQLINVSVKTDHGAVCIRILDNGQGFVVKQIMNHHSFGIQSAESRTNYLKGEFSLNSSVGKGTVVNIKIPL